jgi:hypothetical protein
LLYYTPYFRPILIGPKLFKLCLNSEYKLRHILLVIIKVLKFKAEIKRQSSNLYNRSIYFNIIVLSFILCLYNKVLNA